MEGFFKAKTELSVVQWYQLLAIIAYKFETEDEELIFKRLQATKCYNSEQIRKGIRLYKEFKNFDFDTCEETKEESEVELKSETHMPENFPNTNFEKVDYSLYLLTTVLETISPTLIQLQKTCNLIRVKSPNIIIANELKKSIDYFDRIKADIDEAYNELKIISERTRSALVEEREVI